MPSSVVCLLLLAVAAALEDQPTRTLKVPVDHDRPYDGKFELWYDFDDRYWDKNGGPIIFELGGEDALTIEEGLVDYLAKNLNGLMLYAEHRYYGESLPFGNNSFEVENMKYLTTSQALADYVKVIKRVLRIKAKRLRKSPVIAVGGSYSGMLSAYMRIKYPHIISGAIASSAPLKPDPNDCGQYFRAQASIYDLFNENCTQNIRKTWIELRSHMNMSSGRDWLYREFDLCEPPEEYSSIYWWIVLTLSKAALYNYPYDNSYPANTVKTICSFLAEGELQGKSLLKSVYSAINTIKNFTGDVECHELYEDDPKDIPWLYQSCTELDPCFYSDGEHDMIEPWTLEDQCRENFGPDIGFSPVSYDLNTATNIIFSNGLLDPWSSMGVLENVSSTVTAVIIPDGAHCSDMLPENETESPSLKNIRQFYVESAREWIEKWKKLPRRPYY